MKKLFLFVLVSCLSCIVCSQEVFDSQRTKDYSKRYVKIPAEVSLYESSEDNFNSSITQSPVLENIMRTSADAMLYGAIVHSTKLDGNYGIYRFKRSEVIPKVELIKRDDMFNQGAGCIADDKYCWYSIVSYMGYLVEISYNVFNAETWELESSRNLEVNSMANYVTSLTYDPNRDEMFAISWSEDGKQHVLNRVDIESGELTPLAEIGNDYTYYTLSVDSEGILYSIAGDGGLYKINENGSKVLIGKTGILPTYLQSATYDEDTGLIYWAAFTEHGESFLCEVNPLNGNTEKIGTFPNNEEICGLFINTVPLNSAPAEVLDLSVEYKVDGGMDAVVSCTAPLETYGGTILSGDVTVVFKIDNEEVKSLSVAPGEKCSFDYIFTEGSHRLNVVAYNESGEKGPVARLNTYSGFDKPGKVEDLNLKISKSGLVELSWNTPRLGLNGGYYDKSKLSYTITRFPGNVIVAENFKENIFSQQLDNIMNNYFYTVTSYVDGMEGGTETSNQVIYGSMCAVPYMENFEDISSLRIFTVIDANSDMFKWNYENGYMYYTANYAEPADDWIITPPIKMETGKVYEISFDTWVASSDYVEKLKVTIGDSNDPSNHEVIGSYNGLTNENSRRKYVNVTVEEDKGFYIGFQACSDADMYDLFLDNISIEELGSLNIPTGVSDLNVRAAGHGELKATVTFKAPMMSYNNNPLNSITKIEIYKDTNLVHEFSNATPGREYSWVDNNAEQGYNNYAVVCYNEYGRGQRIESDKLIGIDLPKQVREFKMLPIDDKVVELSWNTPDTIGLNGGYVDVDNLRYTIYLSDDTRRFMKIADGISECNFLSEDISLLNYQSEIRYDIYATSIEGNGEPLIANIVVGKPYSVPFSESLSNMKLNYNPWINVVIKGKECWKGAEANLEYTVLPQDNDGGMFTFYSDLDSEAEEILYSPLFTLGESIEPNISLWFYHIQGYNNGEHNIKLEIIKQNGDVDVLDTIEISDEEKEGWTYYTYSLSKYKDERAVKLALHGYSVEGGVQMLVDNIRVDDKCNYDLQAMSIIVPKRVNMNTDTIITVSVQNFGEQTAESFDVLLYKDNSIFDSKENINLEPGKLTDIEFFITTNAWDAGKTSKYYADVVFDKDEKLYNNKTNVADMLVKQSGFRKVDDLSATIANNIVTLKWSPIENSLDIIEKDPIVEGAEDYDPFSITDFGDWTVYDGDGQATYAAIGTMSYPNKYMPMAWQIWAPEEIGLSGIWSPRTGKHSFISWAATGQYVDGGNAYPKNDDWLISPRVKGGTEISFYACIGTNVYEMPELLDIYVSYSDNNPDSFEKIGRAEVNGFGEWEKFSFNLPEDVQYFALRYVSVMNFAIMIDDICYTPTDGQLPEVIGYNIYRNGERINEQLVVSSEYSEKHVSGNIHYAVSAVYKHGESGISNIVEIGSGIDNLNVSGIKIYTDSGNIIIETDNLVHVEVYSVGGCVIYNDFVLGKEYVSVENGMYIVSVNGVNYKIII